MKKEFDLNKTYSLDLDEIEKSNGEGYKFPKYTTQFLNNANSVAQATRSTNKEVGSMNELIGEFSRSDLRKDVKNWCDFYLSKHPNGISFATNKLYNKTKEMPLDHDVFTYELCEKYITDLLINKTYSGFLIQEAIFNFLSKEYDLEFKNGTPEDEQKGIDGYLGDYSFQVKPVSKTTKGNLNNETYFADYIIFYKKATKAIKFNINKNIH